MSRKSGRPQGQSDGYRGLHRAGSRKGEVHAIFDRDGPDAARRLAAEAGLQPSTYQTWAVAFRRQSLRSSLPADSVARVPTNVSLDASLLAEAKSLGVNVSRVAEAGLAAEVTRLRAEQWLEENSRAIHSSNEYVERHGLPLAKHRLF